MRVHMLHFCIGGSRLTITQSYKHTMQQAHMHMAVTSCIEAKKLLSHRRQSDYSVFVSGVKMLHISKLSVAIDQNLVTFFLCDTSFVEPAKLTCVEVNFMKI